ncbi:MULTISPECIES: porin [Undibacterium]|uniref:Porin n=1 Tax=Undibacterium umbellatum TaxID=2762300 RepID=A0ABR6ZG67_9BURK|nr:MULTISPECIES: porin [Undibacterium]MBC3910729.1 porin [Undibacterium umbellatum]MDP1978770.1 porin [Undibacterium sp.]
MKKSILAFAVLSAFAATASAQSSVIIYGIVDAAVVATTNATANGGSKFSMDAGQLLTSRWGIKGSEDLGGGLKANFNLEGTLANDTGTAGAGYGGNVFNQVGSNTSLFDRLSWVGLSGSFGSVTLGRNNILGVDSVGLADPISLAHAGSNPNVMVSALNSGALYGGFGTNQGGSGLRQNNSIKYVSPIMSGFGGALMYGFGEKAGDNTASNYAGVSGFFTDGTNGAALSYAKLKDNTGGASLSGFAGGAKFKVAPTVMLRGTYAHTKVEGKIKIDALPNADGRKLAVIGLGADFSLSDQMTLTTAFYNTKRSGDISGKADQYILLGKYAFSKRTTAYASLTYARAGSVNAQDVSLALGIIGAGNSSATRTAVGVLHAF